MRADAAGRLLVAAAAVSRLSVPPTAVDKGFAYRVRLKKPLGIMFEEKEVGKPEGVVVAGLVEDGNAELDGRVLVGDRLVKVSAVQFGGQQALLSLGTGTQFTQVSRDLIPATGMVFDTVMAAIGSNDGRHGYTDVVLELQHTEASVPRSATKRAARLEESNVEWDGASGTSVNGVSTPLRPGPDNF